MSYVRQTIFDTRRLAQMGRWLAIGVCLLAIVAGIPGLPRAMLSPIFSMAESNSVGESESEAPVEESTATSTVPGFVSCRSRDQRDAAPAEGVVLATAIRNSGRHRADQGASQRCRGATQSLRLRC